MDEMEPVTISRVEEGSETRTSRWGLSEFAGFAPALGQSRDPPSLGEPGIFAEYIDKLEPGAAAPRETF